MFKAWFVAIFCAAAFGGSLGYSYVYTGAQLVYCNGAVPSVGSLGNCPSNYQTDYIIASLTFRVPPASSLSSINETSNLIAWRMGDALGHVSFSSDDTNAAAELTSLTLSTDSSAKITGWTLSAGTPDFASSLPQPGDAFLVIANPPLVDPNDHPEADSAIVQGGSASPAGFSLNNYVPGQWTQVLQAASVDVAGVDSCGYASLGFPANSWAILLPSTYPQAQVALTKSLDLCSANLLFAVLTGQHFLGASLIESQPGVPDTVMSLTDVIATNYEVGSSLTNAPVEGLELAPTGITPQGIAPSSLLTGSTPGGRGVSMATIAITPVCPSTNVSGWEFQASQSGTQSSRSRDLRISPLAILKPVDACSQSLLQASVAGTVFSAATLAIQTSLGLPLRLTLFDVTVIDDTSGTGVPYESLSLTFDRFALQVGGVAVTYDLGGGSASTTLTQAVVHSATLSWVASTSPSIAGYNIYRGTGSGGPYGTKVNAALIPATTYTDTAVQAGQTYYYVATAVNADGAESGNSNEATAVIPSP